MILAAGNGAATHLGIHRGLKLVLAFVFVDEKECNVGALGIAAAMKRVSIRAADISGFQEGASEPLPASLKLNGSVQVNAVNRNWVFLHSASVTIYPRF